MNDQNQNIQPDYGFILNQGSQEPQKKPKSKKVIVLFVLSGLMIVLFPVLLVLERTSELVPGDSNEGQSSQQETTEQEQVARAYLAHIDNGELDQAYGLLSSDLREERSFEFFEEFVPQMYGNIDKQNCDTLEREIVEGEDQNSVVTLQCQTIEAAETEEEQPAQSGVPIVFSVVEEGDEHKIQKVEMAMEQL